MSTSISDPSSLSNPDQVLVSHLDWEATIDFEKEVIFAIATYDVKILKPGNAKELKLDTSHLKIKDVKVNGSSVAGYSLGEIKPNKTHLGQCLSIPLTNLGATTTSEEWKVAVHYETTQQCTATQWLPPSQTSGKKYPYMFTQCQAIHARSLLPCMDCPGVKMTYDCRVTVPSWAVCVMSALSTPNNATKTIENTATQKLYSFRQPIRTPAYLFALAVGNLASHDISPRCRIWSEPTMIDAAAYEFGQVEDFLKIAEDMVGVDYVWGRYDLLCLPPSFPYGGMENPCLTFITPTLLAGDRSLADVVAHEIMHSWSGNLVTNATWEHFWLNEGWTRFLQRKVMMKIKGDDLYFDFDAMGGMMELSDSINDMPDDYTRLVPILGDNDPDDAFSRVPYEKGFCLLFALEKLVGADKFLAFTRAYFEEFKFGTITSQQFREFFEKYFRDVVNAQTFDWETWLHLPGMPPDPGFDRSLAEESEKLALDWVHFDNSSVSASVPTKDISRWVTLQTTCFLDEVLIYSAKHNKALKVSTIQAMKSAYGFDSSQNAEILFRFCRLAIESGDKSILSSVVRFITTQGRMKYIRPLYRSLFNSHMGKSIAVSTFLQNKDFYHPIAAKMVANDLGETDDLITGESNAHVSTEESGEKSFLKIVILGGLLVLSATGVVLAKNRRR